MISSMYTFAKYLIGHKTLSARFTYAAKFRHPMIGTLNVSYLRCVIIVSCWPIEIQISSIKTDSGRRTTEAHNVCKDSALRHNIVSLDIEMAFNEYDLPAVCLFRYWVCKPSELSRIQSSKTHSGHSYSGAIAVP